MGNRLLFLAAAAIGCTAALNASAATPAELPPSTNLTPANENLASSAARKAFDNILRDYTKARFRNVKLRKNEGRLAARYVYCGEVNAPNGYGGLVGWKKFLYSASVSNGTLLISSFDGLFLEAESPDPRGDIAAYSEWLANTAEINACISAPPDDSKDHSADLTFRPD